ncbi:MAG: hypothetical protein QN172_09880 [Armatimonadota bacterium]|nr:hypothetical protein [Armatimonadota bacterium]MDR7439324.1 hypothetical protein [Armatimonadota bacterium]MDR7562014.1 hypothetical protein [Armatimonadota bacterium]MDR7567012.1 hypothetical protein [Armatimonadota bacterium]MDR7602748.1 hypothetical protein [Armatimonadota bacterium]
MSRTAVWWVTAASAAFLAAAGVTVGMRLAGAAQGPAGQLERRCGAEVQRLEGQVGRLRRLVAAYREREAVYRQRLQEANEAVERLNWIAWRGGRAWPRVDGQEREGHEGRGRWDGDD